MELPIKPKPTKKYLELGARDASLVAWKVARQYSPDREPDMAIFREWTQAHLRYAAKALKH